MQKVAEETYGILSIIKENYATYKRSRTFEVKPQMPAKQVSLFVRQAVRKNAMITIQLNPTPHNKMVSEATGFPTFSPRSSQVILTSRDKRTVHLINAETIRHIRLTN